MPAAITGADAALPMRGDHERHTVAREWLLAELVRLGRMNGRRGAVATSGGAGGMRVPVDAAGMGLPVAGDASRVTVAAKP